MMHTQTMYLVLRDPWTLKLKTSTFWKNLLKRMKLNF